MSLPTDQADDYEVRAAAMRTAVQEFAAKFPDMTAPEVFAYLMNLGFQMAFMMGTTQESVLEELHVMVDRSAEIYGPMTLMNGKRAN